MFAGATLKNDGTVNQEEMDNITTKLSYDNYNLSKFSDEGNDRNNTFTHRLIYKYADFIMFAGVEGIKVGLEFGYNNPKYNFGLAWKLMFASIFAMILIPLIQLILFIGYGIYNIVIFIKKSTKKRHTTNSKK